MKTKAKRSGVGGLSRVEALVALSSDEVKVALERRGLSIRSWAEAHGFPPASVHRVVSGRCRARYGTGHRIAVALGLKLGIDPSVPLPIDPREK